MREHHQLHHHTPSSARGGVTKKCHLIAFVTLIAFCTLGLLFFLSKSDVDEVQDESKTIGNQKQRKMDASDDHNPDDGVVRQRRRREKDNDEVQGGGAGMTSGYPRGPAEDTELAEGGSPPSLTNDNKRAEGWDVHKRGERMPGAFSSSLIREGQDSDDSDNRGEDNKGSSKSKSSSRQQKCSSSVSVQELHRMLEEEQSQYSYRSAHAVEDFSRSRQSVTGSSLSRWKKKKIVTSSGSIISGGQSLSAGDSILEKTLRDVLYARSEAASAGEHLPSSYPLKLMWIGDSITQGLTSEENRTLKLRRKHPKDGSCSFRHSLYPLLFHHLQYAASPSRQRGPGNNLEGGGTVKPQKQNWDLFFVGPRKLNFAGSWNPSKCWLFHSRCFKSRSRSHAAAWGITANDVGSAKGGNRVKHWVERYRPHLALILLGTNDLGLMMTGVMASTSWNTTTRTRNVPIIEGSVAAQEPKKKQQRSAKISSWCIPSEILLETYLSKIVQQIWNGAKKQFLLQRHPKNRNHLQKRNVSSFTISKKENNKKQQESLRSPYHDLFQANGERCPVRMVISTLAPRNDVAGNNMVSQFNQFLLTYCGQQQNNEKENESSSRKERKLQREKEDSQPGLRSRRELLRDLMCRRGGHPCVHVVDPFTDIYWTTTPTRDLPKDRQGDTDFYDGLHPSPRGEEKIAGQFLTVLTRPIFRSLTTASAAKDQSEKSET